MTNMADGARWRAFAGTHGGTRRGHRRSWAVLSLLPLFIGALVAWYTLGRENVLSPPQREASAFVMAKTKAGPEKAALLRVSARGVPQGFMLGPGGKLLPRFVSLARTDARVRLGPSPEYPVAWIVRLKNVPLEVMAETGDWLRVRDHEGEEGWIHVSAIHEVRHAFVAPWNRNATLPLRQLPSDEAPLKAVIKGGVLVRALSCNGRWCEVQATDSIRGWIRQEQLWGVYADERF